MSSDASCEESSVREGAGYDKAFGSGNESEDSSIPSERERRRPNLLTAMRVSLREIRMRKVGMEMTGIRWMLTETIVTGMRDLVKEPWRVPEITVPSFSLRIGLLTNFCLGWAVRFLGSCIFVTKSQTTYQSASLENERCYSGRTADVGMYDAMFAAGLRLPLTAIHR